MAHYVSVPLSPQETHNTGHILATDGHALVRLPAAHDAANVGKSYRDEPPEITTSSELRLGYRLDGL